MEVLPLRESPDSLYMQSLNEISGHENFIIREVMSRVSTIAFPVFAVLGAGYNLVGVVVKLPVMAARYTVGFIPNSFLYKVCLSSKKEGTVADSLLRGTDVVSMTRQLAAGIFGPVTGALLTILMPVSPLGAVKIANGLGIYVVPDLKKKPVIPPMSPTPPLQEIAAPNETPSSPQSDLLNGLAFIGSRQPLYRVYDLQAEQEKITQQLELLRSLSGSTTEPELSDSD